MIITLKIKKKRKQGKKILLWIQRHKDLKQDIQQILQFFKDQILVSKKRKILPYYRITSENPAIALSLFSTIQDLISEIYFKDDTPLEIKETLNP